MHITEEREEICSIEKGPRREVNQPLVRIDASSFAPIYLQSILAWHAWPFGGAKEKEIRNELDADRFSFGAVAWRTDHQAAMELPLDGIILVQSMCAVKSDDSFSLRPCAYRYLIDLPRHNYGFCALALLFKLFFLLVFFSFF